MDNGNVTVRFHGKITLTAAEVQAAGGDVLQAIQDEVGHAGVEVVELDGLPAGDVIGPVAVIELFDDPNDPTNVLTSVEFARDAVVARPLLDGSVTPEQMDAMNLTTAEVYALSALLHWRDASGGNLKVRTLREWLRG